MSANEVDFKFIEDNKEKYAVTQLVKLTSVSRSGFYAWLGREVGVTQEERDKPLLNMMMSLYITHGGNLGNLRFKDELANKYEEVVSVKRVTRMRRMYNLPLKTKRKFKVRNHPHIYFGNLLNRNFKAIRPGIKFCIDITYLEVSKPRKNFMYLCAIKDLFNNEIIAYSIGQNQSSALVNDALDKLKKSGFMNDAILHSDQGTQFTNPTYVNQLQQMHLTQSMSRRGNCWDNACIESFFGKLKTEIPGFSIPETEGEMIEAVIEYITYYNEVRPQLKFKMSPIDYRKKKTA